MGVSIRITTKIAQLVRNLGGKGLLRKEKQKVVL